MALWSVKICKNHWNNSWGVNSSHQRNSDRFLQRNSTLCSRQSSWEPPGLRFTTYRPHCTQIDLPWPPSPVHSSLCVALQAAKLAAVYAHGAAQAAVVRGTAAGAVLRWGQSMGPSKSRLMPVMQGVLWRLWRTTPHKSEQA